MNKNVFFCQQIKEEMAYSIDYFLEEMKSRDINQITVSKAIREIGSDYFFCKKFSEVGEKSEGGCGKMCKAYKPRNVKSGCCKHIGYCYVPDDEKYLLTSDGKLTKIND
jgi:hypothetical protein